MPDSLQRLAGLVLSVLTLPIIAVLAVLVRLDSAGPGIHRAERIGRGARPFTCFKLRTMRDEPGRGPGVTASDDPRISRVGRILRRSHLDELPQVWNVARGDMRLVGPRPEAPSFVEVGDPLHRRVFSAVPGITGLTQLLFIDEASMLGGGDSDEVYRTRLLPAKLEVDAAYLDRRGPRLDLWIMGRTIGAIARGAVDLAEVEDQLGFPLPLARTALRSGRPGDG
jgi:lipopolysaccharide/colanic/teichoic acid biosynthesis glycosyltransferase